jgi:ATP-dependent RNA helicase DBP3
MSKRKYEDADAIGDVHPGPPELKKAKKEKTSKSEKKSEAKRNALKEAKRQSKEAEKETNIEDVDEQERQRRKVEKKAERLAKKLAKRKVEEAVEASGNDSEDVLSKAAVKAANKAAKEAKKAKKAKTARSAVDDSTASATPARGVSTASSVAESKGASSATSPQPATPADPANLVSVSDTLSFFRENQITIDEDESITSASLSPITNFAQLPLTDESERAPFANFKAPTPIQATAWPYLLAGRDVIGVAETGSGKTWAFGVPCIRYIKELPREKRLGVKAVIVSPTRELALQIQQQIEKLAGPAKLRSACLYGGVDKAEQRTALKKANIIVATPGRLNDLIDEGAANLSSAQYVVLDEADRMLDKGFEDAVRQIISATSQDRQTLMFTATWPPSVRELASTFMKTPVKIIIGDNPTGELRANARIQQLVEVIAPDAKNGRLIQLLKRHQSGSKKNDRILVFCLYKKEAQRVHQFLQCKDFKVAGIHGDMSQSQRIKSLEEFKSGKCTLLVATDVAARGLDIPAVKVVINVTFPLTAEDYVHRIGRTGRAGQDGLAITLFTEHDKANSGA